MNLLLFLVIFFISFPANSEDKWALWNIYASLGVNATIEKNMLPVEGDFVAAVKPPVLTLDDREILGDFDKYDFGWLDYYYFSQTINCKKMKGKHFHISNYAKLNLEKIFKHVAKYKKWRLNKTMEEYKKRDLELDEELLFFNIDWHIKNLLNQIEIDLYVFISTSSRIIINKATDKFTLDTKEWQRLNVEVDIPENCKAVTISASIKGMGDFYLDDFTIVERGKNISPNRPNARFLQAKKFNEILDLWIGKSKNVYEFDNMSFEKKTAK